MSHAKKKPPIMRAKKQEQVNKKALIWIGAAIGVVIVALAVMLALDV